jgi:hypothetical protein
MIHGINFAENWCIPQNDLSLHSQRRINFNPMPSLELFGHIKRNQGPFNLFISLIPEFR